MAHPANPERALTVFQADEEIQDLEELPLCRSAMVFLRLANGNPVGFLRLHG